MLVTLFCVISVI